MEPLKSYLTKEGWKKDLQQTVEDLSGTYSRFGRSLKSGNTEIGCLVALTAMPICAYLGTYVGQGIGWAVGNVIDCIPYLQDLAPWLAERSGLIKDASAMPDLNEDLYQTIFAIGGFWNGLAFPLNYLAEKEKNC